MTQRTARALLVVPPFLKYASGPLLGPAMLAGAAQAAGHSIDILDLNARFLSARLPARQGDPRFVGDHDRASEVLSPIQRAFRASTARFLPAFAGLIGEDPVQTLPFEHAEIVAAAVALAGSAEGAWIAEHLASVAAPDVVGVSVLYSGQVLWGLATSILARRRWPRVPVVWGGPHVTALQDRIAADPAYGAVIDGFVFGYAERTFVAMLDALAGEGRLPAEVCAAGTPSRRARDDGTVVPVFCDLHLYGSPRVTLPVQCSRGCAYGRCRFCTYPAIEGSYRPLSLVPLRSVVVEAARISGNVAVKDSLLLPARLVEVAEIVGGRVPWSACTKLHPALDERLLSSLAGGGCWTLEFGLETLTRTGQLLIDKRQTPDLFLRTLDAADRAGISVVVNYITGFPGVPAEDDAGWLAFVHQALADRPALAAKIEHNRFQLERRSPLGRAPATAGLRVTEEWPWATVLGWEEVGEISAAAS